MRCHVRSTRGAARGCHRGVATRSCLGRKIAGGPPVREQALERAEADATARHDRWRVAGHPPQPLDGPIVTLDAGLVCADTTHVVRAQHGHYLGVVTGNQAAMNTVVDDWLAEQVFSRAAAADSTDGTHHREVAGTPGDP